MKKDEVFWKNKLDKFSYSILREAGTEMPFSGKYNMFLKKDIISAKVVVINFLIVNQSLTVDVVGLALISVLMVLLFIKRISL